MLSHKVSTHTKTIVKFLNIETVKSKIHHFTRKGAFYVELNQDEV